jgi:hypothetical protein
MGVSVIFCFGKAAELAVLSSWGLRTPFDRNSAFLGFQHDGLVVLPYQMALQVLDKPCCI